MSLSAQAQNAFRGLLEELVSLLPRVIGNIGAHVCMVTNVDPLGAGVATIPRTVEVRINEYQQFATWRGGPTIADGDYVMVTHFREGDRYEVTGICGSTGSSTPTTVYEYVWVYDTSLNVFIYYTTIAGALAYPALASGDYVLISPGVYDESFTLVDGVIITEMVPGTVILHSTSANTCVTCADGGYIQCKEIRCTRSGNNATAVYCSMGATDTCEIRAELINATGFNDVGGEVIIGIDMDGGILTIHSDIKAELVSDGNAADLKGIFCQSGTIHIFGNVLVTFTGTQISSSRAIDNDGGIVYLRGHCKSIGDDITAALYTGTSSDTTIVWGDCEAETDFAGSAAFGVYANGGTTIVHGRCSGTCDSQASGAYGGNGTLEVYGNCYAENTNAGGAGAVAAFCGVVAPTMRVHGDCISVAAGGVSYGAWCGSGTMTVTCGRASGSTADLYRTGGTLRVFMVDFDTYSGTITQYYPMVDDAWIGIAGGAGARIIFDATPATGVINFASCNIGINEAAPGGMQQITINAAAVKGLIIKGAAGQATNLSEWQNSGGTVLCSIGQAGAVLLDAQGGNTVTIGRGFVSTAMELNVYKAGAATTDSFGIYVEARQAVNRTAAHTVAFQAWSQTPSGGAISVTAPATLRGFYGGARNQGTGTVAAAYGLFSLVDNTNAGGTITAAYGILSSIPRSAGTIITGYGIYVENIVATTAYAIYTNSGGVSLGGNLFLRLIKSGATQAAAGAAANELWKTNGHATLPDNVVMIGV